MATAAGSVPSERSHRERFLLIGDIAVGGFFALLTGSLLAPEWWFVPTAATGGDLVSHRLYAHVLIHEALPRGQLTLWMPEVFGGFPLLNYYFPLPFLVIAALYPLVGEAVAFKLGVLLPALLLPGGVYTVSRRLLGLGFAPAVLGATGSWVLLTHEQNSIWGGNLLALLAGEFAFASGVLMSTPALATWTRLVLTPTAAVLNRLLAAAVFWEVLVGLAHGYALLAVGFGSLTVLLLARPFARIALQLVVGHVLAFCALGFWLWPLLEMHHYTTPNDSITWLTDPLEPLSVPVRWVLGTGLAAAALTLFFRRSLALPNGVRWPPVVFLGAAAWAFSGWLLAEHLGLADSRCFPFVLLFLALAAGWQTGLLVQYAVQRSSQPHPLRAGMWATAFTAILIGQVGSAVQIAPRWAQWNLQGAERKPLWHILRTLFPAMYGGQFAPRLLFEHDPENYALGSTRALETLPLELGGRPVLEGLYMESALLGPVIYLTQAEVSQSPSSPLARFPSARLAPSRAAVHMRLLYANEVLIRSPTARRQFAVDPHFVKVAEAPPFELWRLRDFSTELISPLDRPIAVYPRRNWQQHAFDWFATAADRLPAAWPVYSDQPSTVSVPGPVLPRLTDIHLERERIFLHTSQPRYPLLIRMAYHPRWQLRTPGTLHLAAPGFLLVIPESHEVELVFADTVVGRAGKTASGLAWGLMWWMSGSGRGRQKGRPLSCAPTGGFWMLVGLAVAFLVHRAGPETAYRQGWDFLNRQEYTAAAERFAVAAAERRGHGRQQEARYWRAVALDRAGQSAAARELFQALAQEPAGHWVGEALLHLLHEAQRQADEEAVRQYESRLWEIAPGMRDAKQR